MIKECGRVNSRSRRFQYSHPAHPRIQGNDIPSLPIHETVSTIARSEPQQFRIIHPDGYTPTIIREVCRNNDVRADRAYSLAAAGERLQYTKHFLLQSSYRITVVQNRISGNPARDKIRVPTAFTFLVVNTTGFTPVSLACIYWYEELTITVIDQRITSSEGNVFSSPSLRSHDSLPNPRCPYPDPPFMPPISFSETLSYVLLSVSTFAVFQNSHSSQKRAPSWKQFALAMSTMSATTRNGLGSVTGGRHEIEAVRGRLKFFMTTGYLEFKLIWIYGEKLIRISLDKDGARRGDLNFDETLCFIITLAHLEDTKIEKYCVQVLIFSRVSLLVRGIIFDLQDANSPAALAECASRASTNVGVEASTMVEFQLVSSRKRDFIISHKLAQILYALHRHVGVNRARTVITTHLQFYIATNGQTYTFDLSIVSTVIILGHSINSDNSRENGSGERPERQTDRHEASIIQAAAKQKSEMFGTPGKLEGAGGMRPFKLPVLISRENCIAGIILRITINTVDKNGRNQLNPRCIAKNMIYSSGSGQYEQHLEERGCGCRDDTTTGIRTFACAACKFLRHVPAGCTGNNDDDDDDDDKDSGDNIKEYAVLGEGTISVKNTIVYIVHITEHEAPGPIIVALAVSRQDANSQAPLGPGCCFESPYELDARKSHGWRCFSVSIVVQAYVRGAPTSPKPISGIMLALSVSDRSDRLWAAIRNRHPE
ncbi:hypothetical protein EAG_10896 [Camponotus floridanus]|uniref:Uncharacterized protein n=1 Tax=Camponotus floridanus TaxID=104421 RepID=E2ALN0_CAMFO|nr:hypothetical protein EAG_10896 [Camponotus floridanus]